MALDSRARASVSSHFIPAFPPGVRPNTNVDQEVRQSGGWSYSGVLAGGAAIALAVSIMSAGNFIYQRNASGTGQGVTLRM